MNLSEAIEKFLRQERQAFVFRSSNGQLIHSEQVPYQELRDADDLECIGFSLLHRPHPLAKWILDSDRIIPPEGA